LGKTPLYAGQPVAFSSVIPLDNMYVMPRQSVTSELIFTIGPSPAVGGSVIVELVADGNAGHVPNFSAFSADQGSWVNTAGTVNQVIFGCEQGSVYGLTIWQGDSFHPLGVPAQAPYVAAISLAHGTNPVLTIGVGGSGLNPTYIPPMSAFSISGSDGVQLGDGTKASRDVVVTSDSIQIPLMGTVAQGDILTVSYAPPSVVSRFGTGALQDVNKVVMGAITAAQVTAS
jgi:hypothetical protein